MESEQLLDFLDPQQREVASYLTGPLCVRAGAGTGKTRAITYRIAYGVSVGAFAPSNILAVTFTSRAASEMRSRLRDLGVPAVQAQTFHAAALRQLSYFWPHAIGGKIPPIAQNKLAYIAQAATELNLPTDKAMLRDLAGELEWAKVSLIAPESYSERATVENRGDIGCKLSDISALMRRYEEIKTQANVLDFEDVLLLLIGIMLDRPDITRRIREQYRHFVVDEYQDVSPLQHRLLQLWLGDRRSLCVVGDVSQTIYSFAGASSLYLANFTKEFKGAREVELVRDYRSTPQIVETANAVISYDSSRGAVRLISQLPSGKPVSWRKYISDDEEAHEVAEQISRMLAEGISASDIAILYRTNAQSARYEQALAQRGIPFVVRGGEEFFSRREVREAMIALESLARTTSAQENMVELVRSVVSQLGWRVEAPQATGARRDRWEALNILVTMAEELAGTRQAKLRDFVLELRERAEFKNAPDNRGVALSSLHAAKGLEWGTVFLVGMSEGLMPISLAKHPDQVAEERRLLYVGITRAKEELLVSYAQGSGENRGTRKVSRFLEPLWPAEKATPSRRSSYRQKKKEEEENFHQHYPQDEELYQLLVSWRAALAQEIDKPAYVVFHDSTLRQIAIAKPTSLSQLGRIRGVGATKLASWGAPVISLVTAYLSGSLKNE